ncbi:MAG: translesion error-prone DNA polymerase V autoproteolytic subunit [Alphaproteobacteria bacterium]|nr:translesion error-prone DNA polymerase V autoproteolytic subunit [Alphaproteobacteria bacterium]
MIKLEINRVIPVSALSSLPMPLFESRVQAGFPSPGDDFSEGTLDLNTYLIKHKAATFFVRVTGDSMIGAGIFPGDILIVDRSLTPTSGRVIIAVLNGEMTVKRLKKRGNKIWLCAENKNYPPLFIAEDEDFSIWGVVTNAIHPLP